MEGRLMRKARADVAALPAECANDFKKASAG
jgi:hypothetical protein